MSKKTTKSKSIYFVLDLENNIISGSGMDLETEALAMSRAKREIDTGSETLYVVKATHKVTVRSEPTVIKL
jgi:hypothetical protein